MEGWRDPISGHKYTAASETNSEGFSIHIFRDTDGKVRALYSLPINTFDRMPTNGRVLAIRPGNFGPSEIEASDLNSDILEKAKSNGQSVRATLWHGQDPAPKRGTLRNMLDSDTLFARFYTDTGSTVDTEWSLKGAPGVIGKAAQFSATASPDDINWSNTQADLLISATNRCNGDIKCIKETASCMHFITESRDVDSFNQCVGKLGR